MVLDNQKKLDIVRYYKERKTTRWIAAEVHVSLRDISDTIKEYEGAKQLLTTTGDLADKGPANPPRKTTIVDAFKQFEKEPSLVKNIINLNMEDVEQFRKWHAEYIDLKGRSTLLKLYAEIGPQRIFAIDESLKKRETLGITDDLYLEGLKFHLDVVALRKEFQDTKNEKSVIETAVISLRREHEILNTEVPKLREEKLTLGQSLNSMDEYYNMLSDLIYNTEQGTGFQLAQKMIERVAGDTLTSTMFGERALIAVNKAIKGHPERLALMTCHLAEDSPYSGVEGKFTGDFGKLAKQVANEINDAEAKSLAMAAIVEVSRNIRRHIRPKMHTTNASS